MLYFKLYKRLLLSILPAASQLKRSFFIIYHNNYTENIEALLWLQNKHYEGSAGHRQMAKSIHYVYLGVFDQKSFALVMVRILICSLFSSLNIIVYLLSPCDRGKEETVIQIYFENLVGMRKRKAAVCFETNCRRLRLVMRTKYRLVS